MLQLDNITKDYFVSGGAVHALKGVSVNFRESEFVSILGHSGCGKTTMLNIIGGLDHYTSGDLIINGRSTKSYKDKDWDVYRNHRIGFIFQSYNLIPHQTVLQNVELALTISGVSKEERVARSKEVLNRVGLSKEYNKKPNQLSGGQCQRVAIARALVNNPEILLADEPTGALDSETSVQIMNLIKEISGERLVIMVTHNPELAEQYSTRIVRLKDGLITEDTNPYNPTEQEIKEVAEKDKQELLSKKAEKGKKKEKAKMSFLTAFKLSLKNLISKKGRTTMVGIAGSIGIIGIATVLAFSAGIKGYVASMQDDMLSGNPITITQSTYDMSALFGSMSTQQKKELIRKNGYVNIDSMVQTLVGYSKTADSFVIKNEITQDYVDYVLNLPKEDVASIYLDYDLDVSNNIYTGFKETQNGETVSTSVSAIRNMYVSVLEHTIFEKYSSYVTSLVNDFKQIPTDSDYLLSQYDLLDGKVATNKDEIMIVLSKDSALTDVLLAQLGYYSQDEFLNVVYRVASSSSVGYNVSEMEPYYGNENLVKTEFSYEELKSKPFTYYPNDAVYTQSLTGFTYNHIENTEWKDNDETKGIPLRVVGILAPKDNISYGSVDSGFFYTKALTDYIIKKNINSKIAKAMGESESIVSGMMTEFGVTYDYSYNYLGEKYDVKGYVGKESFFGQKPGDDKSKIILHTLSLANVGGKNLASGIYIYPVNFEHKEAVIKYLDEWNGTVNDKNIEKAERSKIVYTDNISLIINMINTMIDVVSYALIAFTSISLLVSTVMIGIITYVSVVERIKEIGVIRSLGGRKKDVSHLFNAETFILGLLSGLIGIAVTYGISAVVNAVLYPIIHIRRIAALPLSNAGLMILLSVVLTLISGLIPARSAAKKDPVIALRTE